MLAAGKGKYKVWLKEIGHGDDLVLLLGGGERPHIGSVLVCEPGKKARIINRKGHFDWIVAKPIAERKCRKLKRTVVCIAGIHVDNATREEIGIMKRNCRKIERKI